MSRRLKPPPLKTALNFHDQIIVGFLYYIRGMKQEDIAVALNVSNMGRVAEACVAVRKALRDQKEEPVNGRATSIEPTHPLTISSEPQEATE